MIGVAYPPSPAIEEALQLFKIPWEWFNPDHDYALVIGSLELGEVSRPVLDIGVAFFEEIEVLLNRGQNTPDDPLVDLRLDELRTRLSELIVLIEIPPAPWACPYMVALTHDVDLLAITERPWRSVAYAALSCVLQGMVLNGFRLIAARARMYPDPWNRLGDWMALEQSLDVRSTFFFIPFPDRAGDGLPVYRAAHYHLEKVPIALLRSGGWEVGVHGIDNWQDAVEGRREIEQIWLYGVKDAGTRVHWLVFSPESWRLLDQAGYAYDTSFGYNETIGFRAGTLQAFSPSGCVNLLELPLHIQDIALFGSFCWLPSSTGWKKTPCLHLDLDQAAARVDSILDRACALGGAVTVLWHHESYAPPRDWHGSYVRIIQRARADEALLAPAGEIVEWFRIRREAQVQVSRTESSIVIRISGLRSKQGIPAMKIRVHIHPDKILSIDADHLLSDEYVDIRCDREEITVRLR